MMYGDDDEGGGLPHEADASEMGAIDDELVDDPDTYGPRREDGSLYTSPAQQAASRTVQRVTPKAHAQAQVARAQGAYQVPPPGQSRGSFGAALSGSFNLFGLAVPKVAVYGLGALAAYKLIKGRR